MWSKTQLYVSGLHSLCASHDTTTMAANTTAHVTVSRSQLTVTEESTQGKDKP